MGEVNAQVILPMISRARCQMILTMSEENLHCATDRLQVSNSASRQFPLLGDDHNVVVFSSV